jgi:hypothetical protein
MSFNVTPIPVSTGSPATSHVIESDPIINNTAPPSYTYYVNPWVTELYPVVKQNLFFYLSFATSQRLIKFIIFSGHSKNFRIANKTIWNLCNSPEMKDYYQRYHHYKQIVRSDEQVGLFQAREKPYIYAIKNITSHFMYQGLGPFKLKDGTEIFSVSYIYKDQTVNVSRTVITDYREGKKHGMMLCYEGKSLAKYEYKEGKLTSYKIFTAALDKKGNILYDNKGKVVYNILNMRGIPLNTGGPSTNGKFGGYFDIELVEEDEELIPPPKINNPLPITVTPILTVSKDNLMVVDNSEGSSSSKKPDEQPLYNFLVDAGEDSEDEKDKDTHMDDIEIEDEVVDIEDLAYDGVNLIKIDDKGKNKQKI